MTELEKEVEYIWNLHIVHRVLFNKPNFLVKPAAINSALQNLDGKLGINQERARNQINKLQKRNPLYIHTKTFDPYLLVEVKNNKYFRRALRIWRYLVASLKNNLATPWPNPTLPWKRQRLHSAAQSVHLYLKMYLYVLYSQRIQPAPMCVFIASACMYYAVLEALPCSAQLTNGQIFFEDWPSLTSCVQF